MTDVDFGQLLDTNFDNIEKPKPLPVGTYSFMVLDYSTGASREKGTPFVEFQCQPLSPEADVDQSELDLAKMAKRRLRLTFWLTEDSRYRLKEFLERSGISTAGMTIKAVLPQTKGISFKGYVTQQLSNKGEMFNNIDRVIAA